MSITPKRLSPERSRVAAIEAARDILIHDGPQAVTLKAVAQRIGRTHANLLHHFGSAGGLQSALITHLADTITARISDAAKRARAGEADPREVVDLTFDAFAQGAGAMASWMILSGNHDALDPVLSAIHRLVDDLAADEADQATHIREETLRLVLVAMGDALLGPAMAKALGLPRETARGLATDALVAARATAVKGAGG
ncbi:TetR family transcriptional regulator [Sphingomonas sp. H39-1-10]|uniref:TetR family transcriptional regulator n=1 Tax=Sphingomonas TaxID=13687 RepID=UPI000880BFA0|nr:MULTISPECIES: TetR family transcriptional regulator [Sphingomonas]MDF0489845.1 TetR family transcriptional regulator [Sphingomonas pollutisoli]SDA31927.1 transcriptional regulator, TetR family [Sphingomonas sp. NFR15]